MECSVLSISCELANICLPDKRLSKRSMSMLEKLYKSPDKSLPATFGGRAELKAAYRFFDQDCVTHNVILSSHIEKTIERIDQHPTVLLVNDTTDINMSHMEKVNNLGVLNDANSPGCLLHVLKAFTPERLALGIASAQFVTRTHEDFGKKQNKQSFGIEEKESFRWLEDYRKACDIAKDSTAHIIYIADREADLYELFNEANEKNCIADIIIRGNNKRRVLKEEGTTSLLIPALENTPPMGMLKFCMPAVKGKGRKNRQKRDQKGREGREVNQEIKFLEVTLLPSKHKKKKFSPVKIHALYLKEINVPEGEEPINWLLLTTLKIESQEDARKVVNLYLCRWGIETFFHVLKNGCAIEELQFEDSSRLFPCLAMYLIVAWRVMYTMMLGRLIPEVPCSLVFEEDEWECAYAMIMKKRPPSYPPMLGDMIKMIATMGGYLGRKSDGPPGPQVIWIGIQKLYSNTEGWSAHKNLIAST